VTVLVIIHACYISQIPDTADAGSLPLQHGDSVPLHFKTSPTGDKSSTNDFFFSDSFEEKTKMLQLLV